MVPIITGRISNELPKAKKRDALKHLDEDFGVHRVKKIQLHEGFIKDIWVNDLAIITVMKPFKFDHITKYVPLASNSSKGDDFQILDSLTLFLPVLLGRISTLIEYHMTTPK